MMGIVTNDCFEKSQCNAKGLANLAIMKGLAAVT